MSSLFGILDLSRSALAADQTALNATATNVSNQNTVGYTDQVVSFTAGATVTLNGESAYNQGPTATTTSLRDRVLDQRVQQQTQTQSGTAAEAAVLSQVEGVFSVSASADTAGSTQLGTSIDSFFSSLTALAANPSDEPTQQAALSAAQTVASALNAASTGIAGVQSSINGDLASSVTAVNGLTKTIASLNAQIQANDPNSDAGALEDQRQNAITQLSQYIGLNQTTTEANGLTLETTGGTVLVSGQQAYALSSTIDASGTSIEGSTGALVSSTITGGSIGGQLQAQNVDLPTITSALDSLAYRIGTAVNTQNQAGQTSAGVAGAAIFSLPASAAGAAAQITVSATKPGDLATAATGEGSTGNSNATLLSNLGTAQDSAGTTITGKLSTLVSNIGTTSSDLAAQSTTQQASLTQLTTQQDTLSGVNLDTEASNLTQYQRSYQAAAQVLTTINELLADAINMGTEAAVS